VLNVGLFCLDFGSGIESYLPIDCRWCLPVLQVLGKHRDEVMKQLLSRWNYLVLLLATVPVWNVLDCARATSLVGALTARTRKGSVFQCSFFSACIQVEFVMHVIQ